MIIQLLSANKFDLSAAASIKVDDWGDESILHGRIP